MQLNDKLILEKLKNGEDSRSAFKELFELYYVPLASYSLKFCNSYIAAEDIVQEVFIKFWDQQLYFKCPETAGPYLFRAVKNNSLKLIQRHKTIYFESVENQINLVYDEDFIDEQSVEAKKIKLYQEIELLPAKGQEVFKAIAFHNKTYNEVAIELNISINTVKTHYSRSLKQLRTALYLLILFLFIK
ncbi:RNA polymerase sigma factor [Flavobacterium pectinovorum]|uniref:RNA polymerase sigma factor n=1 Tax=Flavobacterium pectinovorum TaxID=29533 RepID=UPI001FAB3B24|nr:sigma-70 family RNA polymerase sigma factor [Flavobacterium pectinovorum]MCI9843580.1 sigma-70 family RNA polymerase sigma factor [Flavobacterium pectinovorum]